MTARTITLLSLIEKEVRQVISQRESEKVPSPPPIPLQLGSERVRLRSSKQHQVWGGPSSRQIKSV
jgi:hypothetical protein